ncbi:hypothetical protein [Pararhodobacter oceanensis]|uniref:hypothetical protein n=1 Tax=Pararhodobacter oceanensis TaxID=2172121 RepID=UPI003A94F11C
MSNHGAAVYIDSPIPSAVRQVAPFYAQDVFSNEMTPLFMRRRPGTAFGLLPKQGINGVRVTQVGGKVAKKLPVKRGGAVFYAFNGQGNLHTVANRSYKHILVLHGESNKRASARPAARLYDYICVAGDIAIDRYIDGGIFRRADVDEGRLIQVGDTFVQNLDGYRTDPEGGEAVLYAPTWEGFGGDINNYSSIGFDGLQIVARAMRIRGLSRVVIRPHPYLGMLKQGLIKQLVRDAVELSRSSQVVFDLSDANLAVAAAVRLAMLTGAKNISIKEDIEPVALCMCDISAMEAICLKERLPHMIVSRGVKVPKRVEPFYARKAIKNLGEAPALLKSYLDEHEQIDDAHRAAAFSVSHPDLASPSGSVRFARLMQIISQNGFWG